MENNVFTEHLTKFGLTRQEACIYECLLSEGKTTGYEAVSYTHLDVYKRQDPV